MQNGGGGDIFKKVRKSFLGNSVANVFGAVFSIIVMTSSPNKAWAAPMNLFASYNADDNIPAVLMTNKDLAKTDFAGNKNEFKDLYFSDASRVFPGQSQSVIANGPTFD
jgi:hypothetical protein